MTTYTSERDVKKQVKKLLDKHDYFWWMTPANGYGSTGIADILAFRSGVLVAIETKFKKNVATNNQKAFLSSIQVESGFAFVVSEDNIDWLEAWLNAFDLAMKLGNDVKSERAQENGARLINAVRELTMKI